ncbi:SH3 domain-containing kinase-binding protein 1 [Clupea harengus]|uniref:SH3 domain-containing kinase-binding protein 1 n=1 Tax=Clupea harengus TaxID=7950 RepID=A0A6P3VJZ9_CLUHA|nr:SH3 domain-containing kinase-binding protein 1 [Clupea harengus]
MGNYGSALTADIEDFKAIVSHPGRPTFSSDPRRPGPVRRSQSEILLSSSQFPFSDPFAPVTPGDESEKPEHEETDVPDLLHLKFLRAVDSPLADVSTSPPSTSAPPTPSPTVGNTSGSGSASASATPSPPSSPSPPSLFSGALSAVLHHPGATLKVTPSGSPALDQLRLQLREMRDELELLKSQHKKEVKLLMSELDEEKKIRLSLQMEVEKIKKQLSKSS